MKSLMIFAGVVFAAASFASAQESPSQTAVVTIAARTIGINYSAPSVKGREGKLFGKDGRIGKDRNYPVWRAGANAATRFHTDADLDVGGLAVPKGDYTLYVDLTDADNWVLIVSKQTGQWGMNYDKAQDLGRVKMKMEKPPRIWIVTQGAQATEAADARSLLLQQTPLWGLGRVIALEQPDLFGGLQKAESILHRQVSPNFLSPQDWRRKLAQKNPFITKISAQPKIFIFGSEDDLRI